jgi:hypothetical protein
MGAAADALLGKAPSDAVLRVPPGEGVPGSLDATVFNDKVSDAVLIAELRRRGMPLMEIFTQIKSNTVEGPMKRDDELLNKLRAKKGLPPITNAELMERLAMLPGTDGTPGDGDVPSLGLEFEPKPPADDEPK